MEPNPSILRWLYLWNRSVRSARILLALSSLILLLFCSAHIARAGTLMARSMIVLGVGLFVAGIGLVLAYRWWKRHDVVTIVRVVLGAMNIALRDQLLRAIRLAQQTTSDPLTGSPILASHYVNQLVRKVHEGAVEHAARKRAQSISALALVLSITSIAIVSFEPFRVVEGYAVFASSHGVSRMTLEWMDDIAVIATPPSYLHEKPEEIQSSPIVKPIGTVLMLRGVAKHPGREIVLTDGESEQPFVSDGAGGWIARWEIRKPGSLFVAAKFGQVHVHQDTQFQLTPIIDEPPKVIVDNTPRRVDLAKEQAIAVRYEVSDDHSIREVQLVFRSNGIEDRRLLSKPNSDTLTDRGGYDIKPNDSFFKKASGVVEITVEAKDNDTVSGPKWGRSAAIVVSLPQIGEAEATRFGALMKVRDLLVDLLASRMLLKETGLKHAEAERDLQTNSLHQIEEILGENYAGLKIKNRIVRAIRGAIRALRQGVEQETKTNGAVSSHERLVEATEEAVLKVDAMLNALGQRDAKSIAKRLADSANDLASTLAQDEVNEQRKQKIESLMQMLEGGGIQLKRLGSLGMDLGEVVSGAMSRIERARKEADDTHAMLAARDLAARLRTADASFQGGSGSGGGVESGDGASAPQESPSDAEEQSQSDEEDLEDLVREHSNEISQVGDALDRAMSGDDLKKMRDEAKEHSDAVRDAVRKLPRSARMADDGERSAATGRQQAESMADSLERGDLRGALESVKESIKQLHKAKESLEQNPFGNKRLGSEVETAEKKMAEELSWAEKALENLQKMASENAKDDLRKSSEREGKLADKTKSVKGKGSLAEELETHLNQAEQSMRQAEKALQQGDGENGLKHQRDAQKHLEMALGDGSSENDGEQDGKQRSSDTKEGKDLSQKTEIPSKDKHKGPEEFRRRVLEGLSKSKDPRLQEAIKRYAEGLLR